MPITVEIVQVGEILLMMVRGVYWVVDEPLAPAGASGDAKRRVISVLSGRPSEQALSACEVAVQMGVMGVRIDRRNLEHGAR